MIKTLKMQNDYGAFKLLFFSNITTAILDFSVMLPVKLLSLIFFASFLALVLCSFSWLLSLKLSLSKIVIVVDLSRS